MSPLLHDYGEKRAQRGAREPGRVSLKGTHLTDLGNGQRLATQHGNDLRYCWPWKKWLVWDRKRWRIDDTGAIVARAKQTVRSIYAEAAGCDDELLRKAIARWARQSERRDRVSAMIDLARSEPGIPILPDQLDRDPWLLNVQNGTIDLRTGQPREHQQSDFITKLAPVAFDPAAECPTWLAFLERIFDGSAELIGFVQRILGYCLTGSTRDHVLPIFYGTGANGKTTLLIVVFDVLGPDYTSKAPRDLLMLRRGEHHPTELADLFGKRLVAAVESAEGQRLNEALIKDLTGGDPQKARRMREDFWQFNPTHKLILATNHKPIVKDTTNSTWRRLRLVPFVVEIPEPEQDKTLGGRMVRYEAPGILAWMVRGCLEWQRIGLAEPAEVMTATQQYQQSQDPIAGFVDECCIIGPRRREKASTLYGCYKRWAENGGEEVITQRRFGEALTERGFGKLKDSVIYRIGIALNTDEWGGDE